MAQKEMILYLAPSLAQVVVVVTLIMARMLQREQAGLVGAVLQGRPLINGLVGPGIRLAQIPRRVIMVEMVLNSAL
jgi:hypothetical protein